jgi:glycosyltransferase involved in cell wall biosynthesis
MLSGHVYDYSFKKGAGSISMQEIQRLSYSTNIKTLPGISVVIPARNEAKNLQHVLPHIPAFVDEVILVDGHSTDGTIDIARRLRPDIRIVKQIGKGKGDALRTGFALCAGDIIVTLDADGSADPGEILRFVEALMSGYDFAKGSRFTPGGNSHDITRLRYLGNKTLSMLVNVLFWTHFSDLCYGYNAFWKNCLDYINVDAEGFEVEALLNLQMHKAHLRIVEVPSIEHTRIYGISKLYVLRDGWRILKTILKERFKILSIHYPCYPPDGYVGPAKRVMK